MDGALISQDGDALVVSASGDAIVVYDPTCATACCAGCSTIRRYDRCQLTQDQLRCIDDKVQPPYLWACVNNRCAANPQFGSPLIGYLNACYTPTDTVIPREQLPDGDKLVEEADYFCSRGCDDHCTSCELYYRGWPCPGQRCTRPAFIRADFVDQQNLQCPGFFILDESGIPGLPCCYIVRRQVKYTLAEVRAAGGVIGGDLGNKHCRTCGGSCQTYYTEQNGPCCCSPVNYRINYRWFVNYQHSQPVTPGNRTLADSITGSGLVTVTQLNGTTTVTGLPAKARSLITITDNDTGAVETSTDEMLDIELVGDQDFMPTCVRNAPNVGIGPFSFLKLRDFFRPDLRPFDSPNQHGFCTFGPDNCTARTSRSEWGFEEDGDSVATCEAWFAWEFQNLDNCEGGCEPGCVGGRGPGEPEPLVRAPGEPWPKWAPSFKPPLAPVVTAEPIQDGALPDGTPAALLFLRG